MPNEAFFEDRINSHGDWRSAMPTQTPVPVTALPVTACYPYVTLMLGLC